MRAQATRRGGVRSQPRGPARSEGLPRQRPHPRSGSNWIAGGRARAWPRRAPGVPANVTSTPRARSSSATASAGITWPAVPPAAITSAPRPRPERYSMRCRRVSARPRCACAAAPLRACAAWLAWRGAALRAAFLRAGLRAGCLRAGPAPRRHGWRRTARGRVSRKRRDQRCAADTRRSGSGTPVNGRTAEHAPEVERGLAGDTSVVAPPASSFPNGSFACSAIDCARPAEGGERGDHGHDPRAARAPRRRWRRSCRCAARATLPVLNVL